MKSKPTTKPKIEERDGYDQTLLAQYEILVRTTSDISGWRHNSNMFYISTTSALLGIAMFLREQVVASVVLCLAGLLLSFLWRQSILSYRRINSAKFKVLLDLEKQLAYPTFAKEQEYYQKEKHTELTITEVNVPLIFTLAYLVALGFFLLTYWSAIGEGLISLRSFIPL